VRIIRSGVTRTVILIGRYAIKVPSLRGGVYGVRELIGGWCRGVLANDSEREWSGQPGTCPVLWSLLGLVNVYPRCEPVHLADDQIDYDAIGFPGPTDRKPDNLGYLHGRLVWVDYDMSWNDCAACRRFGYQTEGAAR
jgi:hypothetical protein